MKLERIQKATENTLHKRKLKKQKQNVIGKENE